MAVVFVVALPGSAAALRVLATSRASLHLSGEHEYSVPPLALGASAEDDESEANEAVTLFLERARAVRRDFRLIELLLKQALVDQGRNAFEEIELSL